MPASTDIQIEELCSQVRTLCRGRYTPEAESDLRRLAQELRVAIEQHVELAKSSLSAKQLAIIRHERREVTFCTIPSDEAILESTVFANSHAPSRSPAYARATIHNLDKVPAVLLR